MSHGRAETICPTFLPLAEVWASVTEYRRLRSGRPRIGLSQLDRMDSPGPRYQTISFLVSTLHGEIPAEGCLLHHLSMGERRRRERETGWEGRRELISVRGQ